MRVLYVGNFNEKYNGSRFYDSNRKLANGFVRNGHQVYQFSDRDVARSSSWFESRKFGILPANRRLLETAEAFQPDLLIVGHAKQIFTRTLRKMKKVVPEMRIAVRNVDAIWHQNNVDQIMDRVDVADAVFITTAGEQLKKFARKNNVVSFFPNIVDKSVDSFKSFENPDPTYRVFYGMAPIFGVQYQRRLADSRMGLNLSQLEGLKEPLYSSDRMAHYTGNGILTLIHRRTGFDQIFKEDELAFYDDFDDLIKKIEYFNLHDDEAREIAENGWRRSHQIFNERLVAKYIEEVTFQKPLSEDYQWPTELHTV